MVVQSCLIVLRSGFGLKWALKLLLKILWFSRGFIVFSPWLSGRMGAAVHSFFVLKMMNILSGETLETKESHAPVWDAKEIFQAGNFQLSVED